MWEIDVMCQMNIQLPEKAKTIRASRDSLKAKYDSIKVGGESYNNYVACLIILGRSFATSIIWCVFMHGYWKPCMKIRQFLRQKQTFYQVVNWLSTNLLLSDLLTTSLLVKGLFLPQRLSYFYSIRECGSTLYVGMPRKQNGHPYNAM